MRDSVAADTLALCSVCGADAEGGAVCAQKSVSRIWAITRMRARRRTCDDCCCRRWLTLR
jgi:hypothetical protein